jgi:acyl-CoA synthetase (AMP-forming)/AMP-acid ligase II
MNIYNLFYLAKTKNNPLFYLIDSSTINYETIDKRVAQYCNLFSKLGLNLQKNATLDKNIIISSLKNKIANYKTPKKIIFVNDLPRNATGKIQKQMLREIYYGLYL